MWWMVLPIVLTLCAVALSAFVCASFLGGITLAGWVFHVIFAALGVA